MIDPPLHLDVDRLDQSEGLYESQGRRTNFNWFIIFKFVYSGGIMISLSFARPTLSSLVAEGVATGTAQDVYLSTNTGKLGGLKLADRSLTFCLRENMKYQEELIYVH